MHRSLFFRLACLAATLFVPAALAQQTATPPTIRVLSDRTEAHLKPMFEAFQKASGIRVEAASIDQGLISRVEGNPTEADVLITKDAELMELARAKHLLQPFKSAKISAGIPQQFLGPDSSYFVDAYRARLILYSRERVKPEQLSTYQGLASPQWKGKLCIRSGYHDYNVALFSQMEVAYGPAETRKIIEGLHANLAREPKGGDRDQAKAIFEGKCDVALVNSYYYPIMLDNPEQKPWAEATAVFYPNQRNSGAFIMRSALALTTAKGNVEAATKLLEFFAGSEGQMLLTNTTYQFPTNKAVTFTPHLQALGAGQPGVRDGVFKINFVPLAKAAGEREAVVKVLNEIQFDKL
jgi:iron(III) transport system substrate-binding protein